MILFCLPADIISNNSTAGKTCELPFILRVFPLGQKFSLIYGIYWRLAVIWQTIDKPTYEIEQIKKKYLSFIYKHVFSVHCSTY